jgi:hypothetical protein
MFSIFGFLNNNLITPAAPSSVVVTQDSNANSFDVSWTDNSGGSARFDIEYQVNSGAWLSWGVAFEESISKNNQATVGYDYSLHGTSFKVRVRARNQGTGIFSSWIESSPITPSFTAPSQPASFSISEDISSGTVTGTHGNVTNETGYIVEYSFDAGSYLTFELNAADDTTITPHLPTLLETVVNGVSTWRMRVRATRYGAESTNRVSNQITLQYQPF